MIIVGKSMPIDSYEQYKRVILSNHWVTIYILETKKLFDFFSSSFCVCVFIYNSLLLIHL